MPRTRLNLVYTALFVGLPFLWGCSRQPADTPAPSAAATAPVPGSTTTEEPSSTVLAVRTLDRESQASRVVVDLDRPVNYEHGYIAARGNRPRRGFVDLDPARIGENVANHFPAAGGAVRGLRVSRLDPRKVRVLLELDNHSTIRVFSLLSPFRILIDADSGREPDSTEPVRTIVLDPGHGGDEFGARHDGLKESLLALDLAQRAATELENRLPGARILLTRRNDRDIKLEERVAFANASGADVFVSIHLNGWTEELERGGVTTFILDTTNDRQALRLAARENGTTTRDVGELQLLLAGLHRQHQIDESRRLAEQVHRETLQGGRTILRNLPDRGVRSAMFYVLVGARMPAVLIEASFLTQPEENAALKRRAYRTALARGIASGIIEYARTARTNGER